MQTEYGLLNYISWVYKLRNDRAKLTLFVQGPVPF